ncbi:MAG: polysaccharide biosynthesis tyrosine autokinase [Chloroflexota bacterium]|nr:MAG: polysaccharide biosynthesis tyrosine autokinase [Chloroflexota bacterium]
MNMHAYYRVFWKRLWLILLASLIGPGVALFVTANLPPKYVTTATLMLNPANPNLLLPYQVSASTVEALSNTYSQFMKTRAFATLVSDALNDGTTVEQVLASLSTQYIGGTQFFKISATATSPETAQKRANTVAQVFIQENVARQKARQEQMATQQKASDSATGAQQQKLTLLQKLEDEQKYYEAQTAALRGRITGLEAQPFSDTQQKDLLSTRQQLIDVENLQMKVITSLVELQSKQSTTSAPIDTAVVIDEAPLPSHPVSPDPLRNALYALVLSLAAAISGAFLLEHLDFTFKTPEELNQVYGMATLGVLLRIGREAGAATVREKIVSSEPRSSVAEAFRTLRTNVQFASLEKPVRSLLITSAAPAEGKTFTAMNLAIAMAQTGKQVTLVDCDLRRPSVHKLLGLSNDVGITTLALENQMSDGHQRLIETLQSTEVEGLKVLTSGPQPPNPSEVLGSKRVEEILRELRDSSDVVIIDSPPAAMVTDAAILATKVDAVLQIVRAGTTRRDMVAKGRENLTKVGARVLGPVLNRVQARDSGYQYRYYYRYYRNA